MASYDASAVVNLAIERIQAMIEKHVIVNQPFLSKIEKESSLKPKKYEFHDDHFIMPNTYRYPPSTRAVAESGYIPAAGVSSFVNMTAALKKMVGTSEITKERLSTGNEKAYIKKLPEKVRQDLLRGFKDQVEIALMGYHTNGAVSKIKSASGATVTVYGHGATNNGQAEPGTKWLRVGQPVMTAAADGSTGAEYTTVSSITDHQTVVLGASHTLADTDIIVPGDSNGNAFGNQITGLWSHLDEAAPTTYQGVTRTSYPELYCNMVGNSGTSTALTDAMIQEAMDSTLEYTMADNEVGIIMMTPKMRRTYYELYKDSRRATFSEPMKGVSSKDTLLPGDKTILANPYHPRGRISGIDPSTFSLLYAGQMFEFEKVGGSYLLLLGTNASKYIYEVRCCLQWQLVCDTPRLNWCIEDLTEAP